MSLCKFVFRDAAKILTLICIWRSATIECEMESYSSPGVLKRDETERRDEDESVQREVLIRKLNVSRDQEEQIKGQFLTKKLD